MRQTDLQRSDGPTATQQEFRVLVVTSFRKEEVTSPVECMTVPATVVTIEPSTARVGHVLETYEQVRTALSTHEPDVVLLDCYETMGVVVTALASRHDVPIVARLVGDSWRGYEQPALSELQGVGDVRRYALNRASHRLNRYIFRRVDGFVTVSHELKAIASSRTGCPAERIGVVPVPMTVDTLNGSETAGRDHTGVDERRTVLTVTNLNFREKFEGVELALSELKPLLEADDELCYVIAGSGHFLEPLEATIEELFTDPSVRDRIYTPGYVDHVADLYALADVFVYVSYRDGYPNAVLEAQTAQLPVVANAAHGMCDQITDGETGYLVDSTRPGQLRARVVSLLESLADRRRIGRQARDRVLRENTSAVIGRQLQQTLRQILDSHHRSAASLGDI